MDSKTPAPLVAVPASDGEARKFTPLTVAFGLKETHVGTPERPDAVAQTSASEPIDRLLSSVRSMKRRRVLFPSSRTAHGRGARKSSRPYPTPSPKEARALASGPSSRQRKVLRIPGAARGAEGDHGAPGDYLRRYPRDMPYEISCASNPHILRGAHDRNAV